MRFFFSTILFVLGLVFGSFGNAWAWRIAHGESIAKGRSHCASCNHILGVLDLFPLFSWIFLKGRCRYCGEKISARYPISELILGLTFLIIFLRWGFTTSTVQYIVLFFILFVASLVDYEIMELPDGLMIAAAVVSLIKLPNWKSILIGAFSITIPLIIIVLIMDKVLHKDSFGGGDIKLITVLGMNFGALQSLFILIIASILGIIYAIIARVGKGREFPFGPILSIAAFISCIFGSSVINWYLTLF